MKKITPFSNSSEAYSWLDQNCDVCKRWQCSAKMAIQIGLISGEITQKMALFIGYTHHSDKFESLYPKCDHFTTVPIKKAKKQPEEQTPKLF